MKVIAYKGRPISFFVDEILSHFALPFYSWTATNLSFRNIEVESNDDRHLESFDALGPGRWIFKKMSFPSLTAKRWQTIVPYFSQILTNFSLNLCNNSDQTWFSNTLTFARSLGRCWKPRPTASLFNISLGTWQTLMHGISCLIPILVKNMEDPHQ